MEQLGKRLLKEVNLELNGVTHQTHRSCKKCYELFDTTYGDERLKLCRQLFYKKGNPNYCFDCDDYVRGGEKLSYLNSSEYTKNKPNLGPELTHQKEFVLLSLIINKDENYHGLEGEIMNTIVENYGGVGGKKIEGSTTCAYYCLVEQNKKHEFENELAKQIGRNIDLKMVSFAKLMVRYLKYEETENMNDPNVYCSEYWYNLEYDNYTCVVYKKPLK